ncbi:hypothetical protein PF023_04425 [Enterococcus thailandicus]|uniref:hypothetical protein n=1 Tax=Enterococcus thailandicus TaxID=417368 RepID=UPI0022EBC610|nr:hypothetical protein [Enterococcus thailandicus]MDA3973282.1 hypothetical protein [Enterococcus thailandicus]MDA3976133.1 hypothetical protein [Enterococcus thailandicus]MDA3980741.1 hypothetical protein [Enterococcus thailandicus]
MNKELKNIAENARTLYRSNLISRDEAMERIDPFVKAYNKKSKEIAKKYNQRPKTISIASFLR